MRRRGGEQAGSPRRRGQRRARAIGREECRDKARGGYEHSKGEVDEVLAAIRVEGEARLVGSASSLASAQPRTEHSNSSDIHHGRSKLATEPPRLCVPFPSPPPPPPPRRSPTSRPTLPLHRRTV